MICEKTGTIIKKYTQEKGVKYKNEKQIINFITLNILLLLQESAVPSCGWFDL